MFHIGRTIAVLNSSAPSRSKTTQNTKTCATTQKTNSVAPSVIENSKPSNSQPEISKIARAWKAIKDFFSNLFKTSQKVDAVAQSVLSSNTPRVRQASPIEGTKKHLETALAEDSNGTSVPYFVGTDLIQPPVEANHHLTFLDHDGVVVFDTHSLPEDNEEARLARVSKFMDIQEHQNLRKAALLLATQVAPLAFHQDGGMYKAITEVTNNDDDLVDRWGNGLKTTTEARATINGNQLCIESLSYEACVPQTQDNENPWIRNGWSGKLMTFQLILKDVVFDGENLIGGTLETHVKLDVESPSDSEKEIISTICKAAGIDYDELMRSKSLNIGLETSDRKSNPSTEAAKRNESNLTNESSASDSAINSKQNSPQNSAALSERSEAKLLPNPIQLSPVRQLRKGWEPTVVHKERRVLTGTQYFAARGRSAQ